MYAGYEVTIPSSMPSNATAFVRSNGVKVAPEQIVAPCVPITGVGFTVIVKLSDGPFTEIPQPNLTANVLLAPEHGSPKVALLPTTVIVELPIAKPLITEAEVVA